MTTVFKSFVSIVVMCLFLFLFLFIYLLTYVVVMRQPTPPSVIGIN